MTRRIYVVVRNDQPRNTVSDYVDIAFTRYEDAVRYIEEHLEFEGEFHFDGGFWVPRDGSLGYANIRMIRLSEEYNPDDCE